MAGTWSPSGRKKRKVNPTIHIESQGLMLVKIKELNLEDGDHPAKRLKHGIAELSRPAREIEAQFCKKHRDTRGRKQKNEKQPAKYHNWCAPFLMIQIETAAQCAGWQMSQTEIVREAQKIDPVVFAGLKPSTVAGWIDRSGT